MEIINFKIVAWVMLFVVLISIQLTLNKILLLLREIRTGRRMTGKIGPCRVQKQFILIMLYDYK